MPKYRFEECNNLDQWDEFVDKSPQGTIFSKSKLIDAICEKSKFFFVKKGDEIVGGVSVALSKEEEALKAVPFMQYFNSILFKNNSNLLHHKRISEEFRITELIINELMDMYSQYHCNNTPYFHDMRAFLWHNYHTPENGVFKNELSYTPILEVNNKTKDELIANFRKDRKYNKIVDNYKVYESDSIEILDYLHNLTFERQSIKRSKEESDLLCAISEVAIRHGFGRLSICDFEEDPASAYLFIYDNKRTYYLFGANHPKYRHTAASSILMVDNILFTKEKGLGEIDLVGCNSPKRGEYKISYNAYILPYYCSSLNLNEVS